MAENPILKLFEEEDAGLEDEPRNPILDLFPKDDPAPREPLNPIVAEQQFKTGDGDPEPVEDFRLATWDEISADLSNTIPLLRQGFLDGSSRFYHSMANAAMLTRKALETTEDAPATSLLAPMRVVKESADYLVQKFGGTEEGALELMERQFRLLSRQQADVGKRVEPQSTAGQVIEAVGALPQEGLEWAVAWETGGPMLASAMDAVRVADQKPENVAAQAALSLALNGSFKWAEKMVPEVPKNFITQAEKEAAQRARGEQVGKLNIQIGPEQKEPALLNWVERRYQEAVRGIYALEKTAAMLGDDEIRLLARANVGNAGNAKRFLELEPFNVTTNKATGNKSLLEIMNEVPRARGDELREYLVAKRGLELEARDIRSGQPVEAMKEIAAKGDVDPVLSKAAQDIYAYQDDVLRYAVDSGMLSEAQYAGIKANNQFYVPARRAGFVEDAAVSGAKGQPKQQVRTIEGSERPWLDPLREIVQQTVRILDNADKNRLGQSIVRHVDDPGVEFLVRRTTQKAASEGAGATDDIMASIGDVTVEAAVPQQPGVPKSMSRYRVFHDGKPTEYMIDPDIANALGLYNLKPQNSLIGSMVINTLRIPAALMRTGTVDMPSFIMRNLFRDALTAPLQTQAGGAVRVPGAPFVDGMFSLIKRDRAYREYLSSGGSQASLVDMDRPFFRKVFRDMLAPRQNHFWRDVGETVITPLRVLQHASSIVETATRMGEFKQGVRKAGGFDVATKRDITAAGVPSRDVTVDFGLRGSAPFVQNWSKISAFFNAQLQGMDRFVRVHRENPKKAATMGFLYLTVPTLAIQSLQMQDAGYRDKYRRLPNWRKTFFWNIDPRLLGLEDNEVFKDRLIPIPIPFEWGLLYKALPEAAMNRWAADVEPEAFSRIFQEIAGNIQPFVNIDDDGPHIRLPTAFQPMFDVQANTRSFFNSPIETEADRELPPEMRFGANTAQMAVLMSEWMQGYLSPKEIEVLVQGWTGTLGRGALETASLALPAGPFGDVPKLKPFGDNPTLNFLLGGMLARTPAEGSSQVVSDFWDAYNKAKMRTAGDRESIARMQWERVMESITGSRGVTMANDATVLGIGKEILSVVRKKRAVIQSPVLSREAKRDVVKKLNMVIDTLASKAMGVPAMGQAQ